MAFGKKKKMFIFKKVNCLQNVKYLYLTSGFANLISTGINKKKHLTIHLNGDTSHTHLFIDMYIRKVD